MSNPWQQYLKNFRQQNPQIDPKDVRKQASIAYKIYKNEIGSFPLTPVTPLSPRNAQTEQPVPQQQQLVPEVHTPRSQLESIQRLMNQMQQFNTKMNEKTQGVTSSFPIYTPKPAQNLTFDQEDFTDGIIDVNLIKDQIRPDGKEAARWFTEGLLQKIKRSGRFPKLRIGTIKTTKQFGNTSVSMGLAHFFLEYMKTQNFNWKGLFYVINYGGGGPSCQVYKIDCANDFISFILEVSMKASSGSGSGNNEFGQGFHDMNINPSFVYQKMKELLLLAMNGVQDTTPQDKIYTAAFITGKSRNFVLNTQNPVTREQWLLWNLRAMDAFSPPIVDGKINNEVQFTPWNVAIGRASNRAEGSYFLPQKVEGMFELVGIQHLYSNLNRFVDSSIYRVPFSSLGIGTTTTQLSVERKPLNQVHNEKDLTSIAQVNEYMYGMKQNPEDLMKDESVERTFRDVINEDSEFVKKYDEYVRSGQTPILALKSGCLLSRSDLIQDFQKPQTGGINTENINPRSIEI